MGLYEPLFHVAQQIGLHSIQPGCIHQTLENGTASFMYM